MKTKNILLVLALLTSPAFAQFQVSTSGSSVAAAEADRKMAYIVNDVQPGTCVTGKVQWFQGTTSKIFDCVATNTWQERFIAGQPYVNPAAFTFSLAGGRLTGFGNSAGLDVGTGAGNVAAGNHTHTGVYEVPLTFNTGLSRSVNTVTCITANTTTFGCLPAADWNTFNNKQAALGFTPPPNTRLISTTSPLQGGGDLSADRTLSLLMWGSGTRPVAASALGVVGNCAAWGTVGLVDVGSPCGTGGSGANSLGFYLVNQATNAPANAINLGLLSTGIVKLTISAGVATPSIAIAADFPTLNQPTTSTAANLSGTPALPNGTTATTQSQADGSGKLATTNYVDTGLATKAASGASTQVNGQTCALGGTCTVGPLVMTSGAGAPVAACAAPSTSNLAIYFDTTNKSLYYCNAATPTWRLLLDDGTASGKSGAFILSGLTSGTVALAVADVAGTAITYVLPSTNGTAGQMLSDSGSTTCPTLVAGAPTTCHLLAWTTLTASSVGLGSVTNDAQTKAAIVPNTAPGAGQILVGNAGGTAYAPVTSSGDATVSATGAIAVTKTGGSAFTALATTPPGTGVATFLQTPSGPNLASALTSALPNTKGGTGTDSSGSTGIPHVAAGAWTYSTVGTSDLAANAVTSVKMAVVNTYRSCDIPVGDTTASALTDAQLGPQKHICKIPAAATVLEIQVDSDAGSPSVIVGRRRCTTFTSGTCSAETAVNLVSGALAVSSGFEKCSNTGGTTGLDGGTTCAATLQNTGLNAGDWIELVSGTAGGTAKFFVAHIIYTVN